MCAIKNFRRDKRILLVVWKNAAVATCLHFWQPLIGTYAVGKITVSGSVGISCLKCEFRASKPTQRKTASPIYYADITKRKRQPRYAGPPF